MSAITIRNMPYEAWSSVRDIYQKGMDTKNATFETKAPEWQAWDKAHRKDCRLVAENSGQVIGWAALSNVSGRCVYSGVAEVSIYIDPAFHGQGVGSLLMEKLIDESELNNIWTLQAGIYPENEASVKLHLKYGFRIVGTRVKIGKRDGIWRDVLFLERRSKIVGIN
jgi:L-amino acid N-acyltransferase YncA